MSKPTFAERCLLAEQCLPDAPYRAMLTQLHAEMLAALSEQPAQLPFGVGGGLVAIKMLLSRDPCVHANTAIQMIDAILAEQPAQQEPVEWQHRKPIMDSEGNTRGYSDWLSGKGLEWWPHRALYTSPQAQRKPLTLREIGAVCGNFSDETIKVVRQTEAAHGIKENT